MKELCSNSDRNSSFGSVPRRSNLLTLVATRGPINAARVESDRGRRRRRCSTMLSTAVSRCGMIQFFFFAPGIEGVCQAARSSSFPGPNPKNPERPEGPQDHETDEDPAALFEAAPCRSDDGIQCAACSSILGAGGFVNKRLVASILDMRPPYPHRGREDCSLEPTWLRTLEFIIFLTFRRYQRW